MLIKKKNDWGNGVDLQNNGTYWQHNPVIIISFMRVLDLACSKMVTNLIRSPSCVEFFACRREVVALSSADIWTLSSQECIASSSTQQRSFFSVLQSPLHSTIWVLLLLSLIVRSSVSAPCFVFLLPLISLTSISHYLFVLPGCDFIIACLYHLVHLRPWLADSVFSQWILLFPRRWFLLDYTDYEPPWISKSLI